MNANKNRIFDVIVRHGLNDGMPVTKNDLAYKKTNDIKFIEIDDLAEQCAGGEWKLTRQLWSSVYPR